MRIVHFSDWHGETSKLPEADLCVCTGDMLVNTRPPAWGIRWPDAHLEEPFQKEWIAAHVAAYGALPASKDKLLLVVRGNHDFVDLKPLFSAWPGNVVEFGDEPSCFIHGGLRFGGFRGVPTINGCWADECTERVLALKCEALGPVDVLITHGASYGYLDMCYRRIGSKSQRAYLDHGGARAHLFGHVHESAGQRSTEKIVLSNAACGVNVVQVK